VCRRAPVASTRRFLLTRHGSSAFLSSTLHASPTIVRTRAVHSAFCWTRPVGHRGNGLASRLRRTVGADLRLGAARGVAAYLGSTPRERSGSSGPRMSAAELSVRPTDGPWGDCRSRLDRTAANGGLSTSIERLDREGKQSRLCSRSSGVRGRPCRPSRAYAERQAHSDHARNAFRNAGQPLCLPTVANAQTLFRRVLREQVAALYLRANLRHDGPQIGVQPNHSATVLRLIGSLKRAKPKIPVARPPLLRRFGRPCPNWISHRRQDAEVAARCTSDRQR
jgi:hypothetical protein